MKTKAIALLATAATALVPVACGQTGTDHGASAPAASTEDAVPPMPNEKDTWQHPFPVNGCRFAFPDEIAQRAGISVTSEVDRGSSGCTYNNGEDAFSAKTFVSVDIHDPVNMDDLLARSVKLAEGLQGARVVSDVPRLGTEAKCITISKQDHQLALLVVKANEQHGFVIQMQPVNGCEKEIPVAVMIVARALKG